jgi:hypothetical protein
LLRAAAARLEFADAIAFSACSGRCAQPRSTSTDALWA